MNIWAEWALTSSILILAAVLLRAAVGRRVSAGLRCAVWALVLIRLLVPVQILGVPVSEPDSGAVTGVQTGRTDISLPEASQGGEVTGNEQGRPYEGATYTPETGAASEIVPGGTQEAVPGDAAGGGPLDLALLLGWLWLGGAIAFGLVLTVFNLRFAVDIRHRRRALACKGRPLPVYVLAGLSSPCLFGVLRPAVYVDPETAEEPVMLRHVLAHEETHYRHGDHVLSLLRCAALAVHWWNPLVWLAVMLSRRDGELFCDEGALKRLGDGERKAYGSTLLTLITARPVPADLMSCATTMSGGKKALMERVERIARPVKQRAWLVILTTVLALTAAACSFAYAVEKPVEPEDAPEPSVSDPTDPSGSEEPTEPDKSKPVESKPIETEPQETEPENVDPNALTAEELSAWAEIFDFYVYDEEKDRWDSNPFNGFFMRFWSDPRQIKLYSFVYYFPGEVLSDNNPLYADELADFYAYYGITTQEELIRETGDGPISRVSASEVNAVLTKYAGVTWDQLIYDGKPHYHERYDAFYSYRSDGPPQLGPIIEGHRDGDIITLIAIDTYVGDIDDVRRGEFYHGKVVLTIRVDGEDWKLLSFLPADDN